MAGGEEGKTNRHAIPLALSHFGYSCPELSFLLSLPNFLYCSVTLLAVFILKMALKLEGLEAVKRSDRLAALLSDANTHRQLCPLLSQHCQPLYSEGVHIQLVLRGLLLHCFMADSLPDHTNCWRTQQGRMFLLKLWRRAMEFSLIHLF